MRRRALLVLAACALLACGGAERYPARGVVEDVNREYGQVLIDHEDIEGLMPAMTMSFDVADAALLERLERGQAIDFVVEFDGRSYRVVQATLREQGENLGEEGSEDERMQRKVDIDSLVEALEA